MLVKGGWFSSILVIHVSNNLYILLTSRMVAKCIYRGYGLNAKVTYQHVCRGEQSAVPSFIIDHSLSGRRLGTVVMVRVMADRRIDIMAKYVR